MNGDYEWVRRFTEFCYNIFNFSDGVMIWVVLLAVFMAVFYSAVCVLLIPFSAIHRVIADSRENRFSIRHILTAALYCYPILLPWAWNCKSKHSSLKTTYYVIINTIWFLVLGLGPLGLIAQMHDEFLSYGEYNSQRSQSELYLDTAITLAIIANMTLIYSIGLLIWKHRFDAKTDDRVQEQDSVKIYFHSSVMFSLWMITLFADFFDVVGADTLVWLMFVVTLAWIVVSCYLMVMKEIRFRRESASEAFVREE